MVTSTVAKFIVAYWGLKSTKAYGYRTCLLAYVAWRAGVTILCHGQFYPFSQGLWIGPLCGRERYRTAPVLMSYSFCIPLLHCIVIDLLLFAVHSTFIFFLCIYFLFSLSDKPIRLESTMVLSSIKNLVFLAREKSLMKKLRR